MDTIYMPIYQDSREEERVRELLDVLRDTGRRQLEVGSCLVVYTDDELVVQMLLKIGGVKEAKYEIRDGPVAVKQEPGPKSIEEMASQAPASGGGRRGRPPKNSEARQLAERVAARVIGGRKLG